MRVAINNNCNSMCPYCFAGKMGIQENSHISLENYKKILDWMVETGDDEIFIYGGEPTIHPEFEQILKLSEKYYQTYSWKKFGIFTNTVELYKFADLLKPYIHYLFNINSAKVLGSQEKYEQMINSISICNSKCDLFNASNPTAMLGCNLHIEENNYDFFWNLVDIFNPPVVRVSVASPQNNKYLFDRDSYFIKMKPVFLDFVDNCAKRNIKISLDCNQIPACYFSNIELFKIMQVSMYPENLGKCENFQQICKPDLTISCCFGDNNFKDNKKYLFEFKNMKEIEDWSLNLRLPQIEEHYLPKCDNCILKENGMCLASCFGFMDRRK